MTRWQQERVGLDQVAEFIEDAARGAVTMRLDDFREMVRRLSEELPSQFLDGIAEVTVSPRTVPHPDRAGIYTLGECVPLPTTDSGADAVQSRIVLYHGSFAALAHLTPGFDWREEAWETLTHELRHHLEWRARPPDLEDLDWAVEQNFARHDGEDFDPGFFLQGEVVADGAYRVEDDVFLDRIVGAAPDTVDFRLAGQGVPHRGATGCDAAGISHGRRRGGASAGRSRSRAPEEARSAHAASPGPALPGGGPGGRPAGGSMIGRCAH